MNLREYSFWCRLFGVLAIVCVVSVRGATHLDLITKQLTESTKMDHSAPLFKEMHRDLEAQSEENRKIIFPTLEFVQNVSTQTKLTKKNIDDLIGDKEMLFARTPEVRQWLDSKVNAEEVVPLPAPQKKKIHVCVIPYSVTKLVMSQERVVTIWLGMQKSGWSYFCHEKNDKRNFLEIAQSALATQTSQLLTFELKDLKPVIRISEGSIDYIIHLVAVSDPSPEQYESARKQLGLPANNKTWRFDFLRESTLKDLLEGKVENIDSHFAQMLKNSTLREALRKL